MPSTIFSQIDFNFIRRLDDRHQAQEITTHDFTIDL